MNFPYVRGRSINFRQLSMHPRDYPSNFCVPAEHCVIFSKHSVRLRGLPSTSVNFYTFSAPPVNIPCDRETFSHFLCGHGSISQLLSTVRASAGPFVNFPCSCGHYVNFHCTRTTFHQLPSTFCASERPSVNFPYGSGAFRQISVWLRTFCQLSLRQHNLSSICVIFPCIHWTFCKLTSTFRASEKFSVNFPGINGTFCNLLSTFRASTVPSINFRQLFVHPRDLL